MAFKLLGNRVAIIPDQVEAVTKSGLIMSTALDEAPETGTITHVGPGRYEYGVFINPVVEVGMKVKFQKRAGQLFKDNGKEYLMLSESDISSILY